METSGGLSPEQQNSLNGFLQSESIAAAIPELWRSRLVRAGLWPDPRRSTGQSYDPEFHWIYPLTLDGNIGRVLLEGGAYSNSTLSPGRSEASGLSCL